MSQQICSSDEACSQLVTIAGILAGKGWLPATSGNLSVLLRRNPIEFAVTASGVDKEFLTNRDIVTVNQDSQVLERNSVNKPSFETQIHSLIYQKTQAGCVLHVHTVFNNLVAEWANAEGNLTLRSIELIKALGIWEEDAEISLMVVDNYADITLLTNQIAKRLSEQVPLVPAVLIRAHGIYVWGADWKEAKKHLQALEFMFEYLVRSGGQHPKPVSKSS